MSPSDSFLVNKAEVGGTQQPFIREKQREVLSNRSSQVGRMKQSELYIEAEVNLDLLGNREECSSHLIRCVV